MVYASCWTETMFWWLRKMNFENIFILPNHIGERSRGFLWGIFIKIPKVTSARSSLVHNLRPVWPARGITNSAIGAGEVWGCYVAGGAGTSWEELGGAGSWKLGAGRCWEVLGGVGSRELGVGRSCGGAV